MVRQPRGIWTVLIVVLVAKSISTDAAPMPTTDPESTTLLLTTETVTETTSSPLIVHFQGNAHLSSVYTLQPVETTILPESDLYTTTEYTTDRDKIVIEPMVSSLSSDVPQLDIIRTEQVAYAEDNKTQVVSVSHMANDDQNESVDKELQSTTASWISTTFAEMSTVVPDGSESTDFYMNVSEHKVAVNTEVSPTVAYIAAEHKSTSMDLLKSSDPSEGKTEEVSTDAPGSAITGEYTTTEEVSITVTPTETAPQSIPVDYEVPKSTEEVIKSTEELPSPSMPTEEASKTELLTNITEEVTGSKSKGSIVTPTQEVANTTQEPFETDEIATNTTEEVAKYTEEVAKHTKKAIMTKLIDEAATHIEENALPTKEVAKTTEGVKKLTVKPIEEITKPTEEAGTRIGEDAKLLEEVRPDEAVSSESATTTAEVFVSSGYTSLKTDSSLDSPRGSRHFTEEASEPTAANETESQPEITTPELATIHSVTQSPPTTATNEQPKPKIEHTADGGLNSVESEIQSTTPTIPTEVLDATSRNVTEVAASMPSSHDSDTILSPTNNDLPDSSTDKRKNVSDASVTQLVQTESDKDSTSSSFGSTPEPPSQSNTHKVIISEPTAKDTTTWLFPKTTHVSSPSSASLESGSRTVKKVTDGTNRSIECTPEPVVSIFNGYVCHFIVLGVTACSVVAAILLVTLVLIRLRGVKRRDASPSLQLCGCLGRTQRAEITPRRAEVSEVKQRPGCNLATDADCRAGEGEEVPLALSARTGNPPKQVPALPASVPMKTSTVKPNGSLRLPAKPDDSPV